MARGRSQVLASLREVTLSHLVAQRKRNGLNHVLGNKQQAVALETNTLVLLEDVSQFAFGECGECTMHLLICTNLCV